MTETGDRAWGPERGIDAMYECPHCSYSRVSSVSKHQFRLHLQKEHGYSVREVKEVLNE